ncbi:MAG: hypothetical protein DMF84_00145 [Acidobacteria bacterium]|nr:MAG: hypothetical protein DMF84_00145 [Acidobacteriota bacterium]
MDLEEEIRSNGKGISRLSRESEAAYLAINLHFHDLRHEAGSRLLEAGWPVHHVQHMLGHSSLQQTCTYLNGRSAVSMNRCGRSIKPAPLANRLQTHLHAATGLFASRLPPRTGTRCFTDWQRSFASNRRARPARH